MSLRCQKLFDSSDHILNLIQCMPFFRGKLVVLSRFLFAIQKARSFVRSIQWSFGKDRRLFFFRRQCRMCPF